MIRADVLPRATSASMGPRLEERGRVAIRDLIEAIVPLLQWGRAWRSAEGSRSRSHVAPLGGFNGAALGGARKGIQLPRRGRADTGFNGAALGGARKAIRTAHGASR